MKSNTTNGSRLGGMGHRVCLAASFALLLGGCGAASETDSELEPTGTQSSELKNGVLVDGSASFRGAVLVHVYWPAQNAWTDCSGVITSRRTLVTAAHCVSAPLAPYTSGWVTALVLRENTGHTYDSIMPQSNVFVKFNPAYNGFAKNDVAVLTANSDFSNVAQLDAIPIAKSNPSGSTMSAMGYGCFDTGATDCDNHLRGGQVVPTYNSTNQDYTYTANSTQPWLCAGDSGGPLKKVNGAWMAFGFASFRTGGSGNCGNVWHWATAFHNWTWLQAAIGYVNCTETTTALFCW